MEPYRQPVLIYNPAAGKLRRSPTNIIQRTTAALAHGSLKPRLIPTTGPDQAGGLARDAIAAGADLVLVLGGDGTINEVVQGLANTPIPLGILPGGTANVLANELGFSRRLEQAAGQLLTCRPARVELGRISNLAHGERYFLLMCGAGLDAAIVGKVSPRFKAWAGKVAYWVAGFGEFFHKMPSLQAEVAGSSYACGFVLVSRVRNYGGDLEIAHGASLLRNDFEIVLFEGENPLRYAGYMLGVLTKQVQKMSGVRVLTGSRIDIRTETPSQIDGEFFSTDPFTVEIVPQALSLLVPPDYR